MKSAQTKDRQAKERAEYLAAMRRFSLRRGAAKTARAQERCDKGRFSRAMDDSLVRAMHKEYIQGGAGYTALSEKYGFSRSSIFAAFRRLNLPTKQVKESLESLPPETAQAIAQSYTNGDSLGKIRRRFGLQAHNRTIATFLRQRGVSIRDRAEEEAVKWKDRREHIPQIIAEYRKGESVTTLARRYNVTPSFCLRWLRRNGVAIRCANDEIYAKNNAKTVTKKPQKPARQRLEDAAVKT